MLVRRVAIKPPGLSFFSSILGGARPPIPRGRGRGRETLAPLSDGGRPAGRLRRASRPLDPLALPSRRVSPRLAAAARPSLPPSHRHNTRRTNSSRNSPETRPSQRQSVPRTPKGLGRSAGLLLRRTNNQTNRCRVKQWPGGATAKTGSRGPALICFFGLVAHRRPRGPLIVISEKRGRKRGGDCTAASASHGQEGAGDKKAPRLLALPSPWKLSFPNGAAAPSRGSH